ncbi:D-hexose-6-phosphate mutarotase [Methylibium sp. Root1272]|uniref:D-hexose-6-phosphate mutarotase n=1 Tax=Methylibium sp. Root1272 TaxID=1736441 RepID=UPI0006F28E94|nr:D-hexose-6-phosphate mutarotase [Methylibium sp. Root1272]KQW69649.1 D-hexose-6-phosphate mutarotase [Methylibium sp. Root1272]
MAMTEVLGQPAVVLRTPDGAQATVLLHGAHVVSWQPAGQSEQLYLSPRAQAGPGKAVRGGIPVIFPQFERRGPLPRHGFARDRAWTLVEHGPHRQHAQAVLRLTDTEATRAVWPHAFEAELTVSLSGRTLEMELAVLNTGERTFEFTAALHTYLRCDDVREARVSGLLGSDFEDSLRGTTHRQEIEPQAIVGEIDRIYWNVASPVVLQAPQQRVVVSAEGFPDRVLWNPGAEKAAALADLPDEDWLQMLCIETGCIGRPVLLAAGQEWFARQTLQA